MVSEITAVSPDTLVGIDDLLDEEEKAIRQTVRKVVDEQVKPHVARWYDQGHLPVRELAKQFGEVGLLGMHLNGYGCAGMSATAYGLACLELEAGDSGIRSLVSVQGSLAMFAIQAYGSEEQRQEWLPRMASGDILGCFGLTESDHGSDPNGMRTSAKRDGDDWLLSGAKMWITNGSVADVAVVWARCGDGVRGFIVPSDSAGFTTNEISTKVSLRASVTSELVFDNVRLPASAVLPGATGLSGPFGCLSEARFGIAFGALGAARDCLEVAINYACTREQFDKLIGGFQITQTKLVDMTVEHGKGLLLALHLGRLKDNSRLSPTQVSLGKLNNVREAIAIARQCRTILGANGITSEYPVMRHANNLESVLTHEGTSEMHTLIFGHALTGIAAFR